MIMTSNRQSSVPHSTRRAGRSRGGVRSLLTSALFLLSTMGMNGTLSAQEVYFHGDQMTLKASNNSMADVMRAVARTGIEVRMDPSVEANVNGNLTDISIHQGFKKLLGNFGYALEWKNVQTPNGKFKQLQRIDVFRVGFERSVRRLARPDKSSLLDVVKDPDGVMYVRDEILIGVKPGTQDTEFIHIIKRIKGQVAGHTKTGIYRVKLPPGSNVRSISSMIQRDYPFAKAEPNYAAETKSGLASGSQPATAKAVENPSPSLRDSSASDVTSASPTAPSAGGSGTESSTESALRDASGLKANADASLVAILDSGLSSSIPFDSLAKGTYDAIQPGESISDSTGHGTQMALIASGAVNPNGILPNEDDTGNPFLAIKAFDDDGRASNFSMMRAIDYSVENDARILSMSWGTPTDSEFLRNTISHAQDSGLIVLAAVGNVPDGTPQYPAAYPGVIGVGALNGDGSLWENSNYGDHVDVVAPGTATFPIGHDGPPGAYAGTSISTPYVASQIGLYLSQNPGADSEEVIKKFQSTIIDAGSPGRDAYYGAGVFNQESANLLLGR